MATLTLEQITEKAANHKWTLEERRLHRASLLRGLIAGRRQVTVEETRAWLDSHEGHEAR